MPLKEMVNRLEEIKKLHASRVKPASEIVIETENTERQGNAGVGLQRLASKKGKKKGKKKAASHSGERETIVDHAVVFVRSAGGMTRAKNCFRNSRCCTTKSIKTPC